jgi:hypothetical protein
MSKRELTLSLISSESAPEELGELIKRLSDPEEDIRSAAAAELASFAPEAADVILGLHSAFIRDSASEEDHLSFGILLCALLEWLQNAGEPASHALGAASTVFAADTPENRSVLAAAIERLVQVLRKSPLTLLDEKQNNTLCRKESQPGQRQPGSDVSGDQDGMESMTTYGLGQLATRLGVSERKIKSWIESGQFEIAGKLDPATREYRFTDDDLKSLQSRNLLETIESLFDDAEQWLQTPNQWLGGLCPDELIGTNREHLVSNIVESIKHGAVA